jgi:hypothetical protein
VNIGIDDKLLPYSLKSFFFFFLIFGWLIVQGENSRVIFIADGSFSNNKLWQGL